MSSTMDLHDRKFKTVLADPPWRFDNRTGKGSPEHKRLNRYPTMGLSQICALGPQVLEMTDEAAHLYLWVPGSLLPFGSRVMAAWGFDYKQVIPWRKVTQDGRPDLSCMGFYYRVVYEFCLFGTIGNLKTKLHNVAGEIVATKTGHSIKPESQYPLIESMSPGPYLELFARQQRPGWTCWGNEVSGTVAITTEIEITQTWREVVGEVLGDAGPVQMGMIYEKAQQSPKVQRAIRLGHKWKAQIRRTLQVHFFPEGRATWAGRVA